MTYPGKVLSVIDGDTILVEVEFPPFGIFNRVRLRLLRINAPELSTQEGVLAKTFLTDLIGKLGPDCLAFVKGPDKYGGRWDAAVEVGGKDLAAAMLEAGHAKPYKGDVVSLATSS